jgi:hypothetical protein
MTNVSSTGEKDSGDDQESGEVDNRIPAHVIGDAIDAV